MFEKRPGRSREGQVTDQWKNKGHNADRSLLYFKKARNHYSFSGMSKGFSGGKLEEKLVTIRTLVFILNVISSPLKVLSRGMP